MSTGSLAFASFMSSAAGRLLRIVAGLAFVAWGWTIHESTAGVILIALGVVAFLAGALNFCPDRAAHRGALLRQTHRCGAEVLMASFRGKPIDFVIDVRSHIEFWLGHLEGAHCIPVDSLADALPKRQGVPRGARILVYCASGARSAVAAGVLKSLGYSNVIDGGGMGVAKPSYAA